MSHPGEDPLLAIQLHQTTNDSGVTRGEGSSVTTDIELPAYLDRWELRADSNLIWRNTRNITLFEHKK